MFSIAILIAISISILIAISVTIKISGKIDLNKIFDKWHNFYITKKYNKKANDYNRLFSYFHPDFIQSPLGEIAQFLLKYSNTIVYYPDYTKGKIYVLKSDKKRRENAPRLEEKERSYKSDYYCHKVLSKNFKYFQKLSKLMESNSTFQTIVQTKWHNEAVMNLESMKKNKNG